MIGNNNKKVKSTSTILHVDCSGISNQKPTIKEILYIENLDKSICNWLNTLKIMLYLSFCYIVINNLYLLNDIVINSFSHYLSYSIIISYTLIIVCYFLLIIFQKYFLIVYKDNSSIDKKSYLRSSLYSNINNSSSNYLLNDKSKELDYNFNINCKTQGNSLNDISNTNSKEDYYNTTSNNLMIQYRFISYLETVIVSIIFVLLSTYKLYLCISVFPEIEKLNNDDRKEFNQQIIDINLSILFCFISSFFSYTFVFFYINTSFTKIFFVIDIIIFIIVFTLSLTSQYQNSILFSILLIIIIFSVYTLIMNSNVYQNTSYISKNNSSLDLNKSKECDNKWESTPFGYVCFDKTNKIVYSNNIFKDKFKFLIRPNTTQNIQSILKKQKKSNYSSSNLHKSTIINLDTNLDVNNLNEKNHDDTLGLKILSSMKDFNTLYNNCGSNVNNKINNKEKDLIDLNINDKEGINKRSNQNLNKSSNSHEKKELYINLSKLISISLDSSISQDINPLIGSENLDTLIKSVCINQNDINFYSKYQSIGFFRINTNKKKDSSASDDEFLVYLKITKSQIFNIILVSQVNHSKYERIKAEKKVKNMLLSKISHEFKTPTINIQNIIEKIIIDANLNKKTLNATTHPELITIYDDLKRIKYLSEVILILISDLSDYINFENSFILKTQQPRLNTINTSINNISPIVPKLSFKIVENQQKSIISLASLKDYICQIIRNLLEIYCKSNFFIIANLDIDIAHLKLVLDDKKLKQIIFNLLSNAIKCTFNGGGVKISFIEKGDLCKFYHSENISSNYTCEKSTNIDLGNNNILQIYSLQKTDKYKNEILNSFHKIKPKLQASKSSINNSEINLFKTSSNNSKFNSEKKTNRTIGNFRKRKDQVFNENYLGNQIAIIIEDTGFGIPYKIVKKVNSCDELLNYNYKYNDYSDSRYIEKKGLGIGLIICKRLSKELGLEIFCDKKNSFLHYKKTIQSGRVNISNLKNSFISNEFRDVNKNKTDLVIRNISNINKSKFIKKGSSSSNDVQFKSQFSNKNLQKTQLNWSEKGSIFVLILPDSAFDCGFSSNDSGSFQFLNLEHDGISKSKISKKQSKNNLNDSKYTEFEDLELANQSMSVMFKSVKSLYTMNSPKKSVKTRTNIMIHEDHSSVSDSSKETKEVKYFNNCSEFSNKNIKSLVSWRDSFKGSKRNSLMDKTIKIDIGKIIQNINISNNNVNNKEEMDRNYNIVSSNNNSSDKHCNNTNNTNKNTNNIYNKLNNISQDINNNINTNISHNIRNNDIDNAFYSFNKLSTIINNNSNYKKIEIKNIANNAFNSISPSVENSSDDEKNDIYDGVKPLQDFNNVKKRFSSIQHNKLPVRSKLSTGSLKSNILKFKSGSLQENFKNRNREVVAKRFGSIKLKKGEEIIPKSKVDRRQSVLETYFNKNSNSNKNIQMNMNQFYQYNNSNNKIRGISVPQVINYKRIFSKEDITLESAKSIIIIVDDNVTILKSLENLFVNLLTSKKIIHKYEILLALDGIEALNLVYQDVTNNFNSIKLIISDEMMNYMNGSELYNNINKKIFEKRTDKIPFVICSAFSNNEHFEKMKILGVEFYKKPLSKGNAEFLLEKYLK